MEYDLKVKNNTIFISYELEDKTQCTKTINLDEIEACYFQKDESGQLHFVELASNEGMKCDLDFTREFSENETEENSKHFVNKIMNLILSK